MAFLKCWTKGGKTVKQEFCLWSNFPSKEKEKLRYHPAGPPQKAEFFASRTTLHAMLKSPSGWDKKILNSNLKLYEDRRILVNVTT